MATTAEVLDPLSNPLSWAVIFIGDTPSPGIIEMDGIEGFERETGWDVKQGKGTQGATLTLKTQPPTKGSITFILWAPSHFVEWATFLPLLKYTPTKANAQSVDIYHPALADLGISSVVTAKVGPIRHRGRGKYTRVVDFIEWIPPPKVSVVSTPTTSQTTTDPNLPGSPPDPVGDAQQKLIAQLLQQAQAP